MSITLDTLDRMAHGWNVFGLVTEDYQPIRVPPGSSSGTQPTTWDPHRAVADGLKVCSTLASVISRLARRAASAQVPWRWWSDGGVDSAGRRKPAVPGELVPWIEYPSKPSSGRFETRSDLIAEVLVDVMLAGEGYIGQNWEGLRPKPGRVPQSIFVESPDGVAPATDERNRLIGWEWSSESSGGYRYWKAEDVIQIKWMKDPNNRWRGLSPLESLGLQVDIFLEILKLQLNRTRRGAAPGMVVKDQQLGNNVKLHKIVEDSLNDRAQETFGGFMVIGGDQEIVPRPMFNAQQLQFLETAASVRDDIWVAYGLHPALGSSDASTLNNMGVAHTEQWRAAVLLNDMLAQAFTARWVAPDKRGRIWIAPDYREIPELARTEEKVNQLKTLVQDCRRSPADAIRFLRLMLPTTQEDEVPLVDSNQIPVGTAIAGDL